MQQAGKPPTKPLGGAGVQGNGERWHKPGVGKDQGERHPEDTPRERPETSPPSQTPRNGTRHQLHWGEQAGAETRNKESGNKPPQQTRHRPRPQQRAATTAPKHKEPQRGNASRDSPRTGQTRKQARHAGSTYVATGRASAASSKAARPRCVRMETSRVARANTAIDNVFDVRKSKSQKTVRFPTPTTCLSRGCLQVPFLP